MTDYKRHLSLMDSHELKDMPRSASDIQTMKFCILSDLYRQLSNFESFSSYPTEVETLTNEIRTFLADKIRECLPGENHEAN